MSAEKKAGKPEYFIDEEHDAYKNNQLVHIDPLFEGTEKDK